MRHIVALSGGKDSTALALYMRRSRPEIKCEYVFADTGRELPGAYGFLSVLETILGPISRIADGWECQRCKWATPKPKEPLACRMCNGTSFRRRDMDYYIERWSDSLNGPYLPSAASRWCTKHLKLRPFDRFVGQDYAVIYIGLRADEDRDGNYGERSNVTYAYPFREDGIDLAGVYKILADAEIKLPDYYNWRSTGGCWNCFYQRPEDWAGLKQNHPQLFEQACHEESITKFKYSGTGKALPVLIQGVTPRVGDEDGHSFERACLICAK